MKRVVRRAVRVLFRALVGFRVPLPAGARDVIRMWTRWYFHRSPFFRHDSRSHLAPLALRVVHECLIGTCPTDFTIHGGRLRFRSLGSPMSLHGYYVGEFEYHLLQFVIEHLEDATIMLDIGAHHGEFAVPIAYEFKRRNWSSQVWSFEPDPANVDLLHYNLRSNGLAEYVKIENVAVSDRSSDAAELLCPKDNSSNTLSENAAYAIGDELPTVSRRTVRTIRIDDLDFGASRVGVIKLDIQGSESDALRGAAATLQRHRPIVVVEVVESWPRANEVQQILAAAGYSTHGLTRASELVPTQDSRAFVSWDWIAIPVSCSRRPRSGVASVGLNNPAPARTL